MKNIIEVKGLEKSHRNVDAVKEISLCVEAGTFRGSASELYNKKGDIS